MTEQYREVLSIGGIDAPSTDDPRNSDRSVSRMTLRQVLLTGLEDVVTFGQKFTHYEQHPDGTLTAHFADGTTATGDVLVGADGSNSPVRKQYLPHAVLKDSGLFGATAKLPLTPENRALLTPKVLRGVTMITAPRGYSTIIHVMEFPWGSDGKIKEGIGSSDADLLATWPGLTFDNTRDYIMLGFGAHRRYLPPDYMQLSGPALHALLLDRTRTWHPKLRALYERSEPDTCFPVNIRTTERLAPWPSSTVTLIGDAIHTMTPGLGVGANTALRDARNLADTLIAADRGERTTVDAVADYERQMHSYAWDLVEASLARFDENGAVYKPGLTGRLALTGMRTGMRMVNHLPPAKRKMAAAMAADRNRDGAA
jgi:2-polyprenyl-6-methoxyphenol hydroxylase-like FAD-dependent oxidoreductase